MIVLSSLDDDIPLLCPATSAMSNGVQIHVQSYADTEPPPLDTSSQRLHIMAQVVLLVGRALQYVYCLKKRIAADEDYSSIDDDVEEMAKSLIRHKESHSWPFCDPITMALW